MVQNRGLELRKISVKLSVEKMLKFMLESFRINVDMRWIIEIFWPSVTLTNQ